MKKDQVQSRTAAQEERTDANPKVSMTTTATVDPRLPASPGAREQQEMQLTNQAQIHDQGQPAAPKGSAALAKMQQSLPTHLLTNMENSNIPDLSESEWGKHLLLTDGNQDEAVESTIGFKDQMAYRRTSQDDQSKQGEAATEVHMTPSKIAKFSNNIHKPTAEPEVEAQVEEEIESPQHTPLHTPIINQELQMAREDSKIKNAKSRSSNTTQNRQKTLSGLPNGQSNSNLNINRMIEKGMLDGSEKNLEFYPAQSERSRMHAANTSQIQLTSGLQQPSETSTNNLLMYSQSIKLNDVESTIHNINNQSMMQSEFDPKAIERLAAEESEKLLKHQTDIEKEQEIMRRLKELKIHPGDQNSARLTDEQRRAMIAMQRDLNMLGLLQPLNNDDSINFSNLDSSIAPSQYNESTTNKGMRDKQNMKLQQQQQAIKAAQNHEMQQKKLKTNFSSQNAVTHSNQKQLLETKKASEQRKLSKQVSSSPEKRNIKGNTVAVKRTEPKDALVTSPKEEISAQNAIQQKVEATTKAKVKLQRSDSPSKKHQLKNMLDKNMIEVQTNSQIEMTSFLSPTHTDTFMTTQDNEALMKQHAATTQNTQSKPGSRDKNKQFANTTEANPSKPGSRDRKDQSSLVSPQAQAANKKDPALAGANLLNFHKYSQITKQNQEKKVEKKEKEKEQRERERELQQKHQPSAEQQSKPAAEEPLEGIITLTDYFEKMNVNKRLEPVAKEVGAKHSGGVGGQGSARRYIQKKSDEGNQYYEEFENLDQIPNTAKKHQGDDQVENVFDDSADSINQRVTEPRNKQEKYKLKEAMMDMNKMADQGPRNEALVQDGTAKVTNPTFRDGGINIQSFSPKQFMTSETRVGENKQSPTGAQSAFQKPFAQANLQFAEAKAKQKRSSKKSGSLQQEEIDKTILSASRKREQEPELEGTVPPNQDPKQYYQETGQKLSEVGHQAQKNAKEKNRPYSQGNVQMNGLTNNNRGEQLRQLLSQQKAKRETNITNIQNQYNQFNQYILTNTDYKANNLSNNNDHILLLHDAPLETRSYFNENHVNQAGFQDYSQQNQMRTQQQFYQNQLDVGGQKVYDHYDDDANFIQNDDGSQSANMMMLDGEIEQHLHINQKINRSIGSSLNHRQARMPPLGARGVKSVALRNDQSHANSQSEAQFGQGMRINSREFVLSHQRQLQMQQLHNQAHPGIGQTQNQDQYQQALIGLQLRKRQSQVSARSHLSREQQAEFLKRQSKAQQRQSKIPVDGTNSSAQRFSRVKEEMLILKKQRVSEQQKEVEDKKALAKLVAAEENKKNKTKPKILSKSERIGGRLPASVLLRIVQHLTLAETSRFQLLCKYVRQTIIYQPEFEGQWVIKSFHGLLSKSGYSGLRNSKLRRIDLHQRAMHFQAQSLVRDSHDEQWHVFGVWANFAFLLTFIIFPILLIVNEEQELHLSPRILLIPTTVAWVLLMLALFFIFRKIGRYHKIVTTLHLTQRQYQGGSSVGTPKGRNTAHCTKYQKSQFTVRFLISLIWALLGTYFGIFVKIYVLDWLQELAEKRDAGSFEFKWIYVSAISFGPSFLLYAVELIREAISSQYNLGAKKEMLLNFITLSINKSFSDQDILNEFGQSAAQQIHPKGNETQNLGPDLTSSNLYNNQMADAAGHAQKNMLQANQIASGPAKALNSSQQISSLRENSTKDLLPAKRDSAIEKAKQEEATQNAITELRNKKAQAQFQKHKGAASNMDCVGVLLNMLFLPMAIYAFLFFAAQRLDGDNQLSFFFLMLPVWVAGLPVFGYVILNGLAAQNTRINKCEKLTLSILVPFGSLVTLILLICYVEGILEHTAPVGQQAPRWLLIVFIPHFLSLLCLYLYLRCLVRPVKIHNVGAAIAK